MLLELVAVLECIDEVLHEKLFALCELIGIVSVYRRKFLVKQLMLHTVNRNSHVIVVYPVEHIPVRHIVLWVAR